MPPLEHLELQDVYGELFAFYIFIRLCNVPQYQVIPFAAVELNVHKIEPDLRTSCIHIIAFRCSHKTIFAGNFISIFIHKIGLTGDSLLALFDLLILLEFQGEASVGNLSRDTLQTDTDWRDCFLIAGCAKFTQMDNRNNNFL